MKKISLLILITFSNVLIAQKHDYIWLTGYDTTRTMLNFNFSPVALDTVNFEMETLRGYFSISDHQGNLQFFSNGYEIYDASLKRMQNGGGLQNNSVEVGFNGHPAEQGTVILPNPTDSMRYYQVHLFWDVFPDEYPYFFSTELRATQVDMRLNGGLGAVVDKNRPFISSKWLYWDGLAACKHANGRDWWLLIPARDTNYFFRAILDPTGPRDAGIQVMDSIIRGGYSQHVFSPDGTKYAMWYGIEVITNGKGQYLDLYDFDRCTGELSNLRRYHNPVGTFSGGCGFSPNSRFLYMANSMELYQFDTYEEDFVSTMTLVGEFDGYQSPLGTTFNKMQLAPDGRIYMCAPNGVDVLHYIEYPDSAGIACGFRQHALQLYAYNGSNPPYFPNYRLGPLEGSPCDTVFVATEEPMIKKPEVTIYPNPASDFMTISFGSSIEPGDYNLTIVDGLGRVALSEPISGYGDMKISTAKFEKGIYTVKIIQQGRTITSERVTVFKN